MSEFSICYIIMEGTGIKEEEEGENFSGGMQVYS